MAMKQLQKRNIPGWVVTLLLVVISGVFIRGLVSSRLLPGRYLLLIALGLLVSVGGVLALTWNFDAKRRFLPGVTLAVLLAAGLLLGSSLVGRGVTAVEQIVKPTVEVADVGVYVRKDDPAQSIVETAGYTFGILREQDRENTDEALRELAAQLGETLIVIEYPGLAELLDSLLTTHETQAIVLNSAFVGLFSDMEGHETAETEIREVHIQRVETVIERTGEEAAEENNGANTAGPVFSVYLSGIDSRSGLIAKSRSDVNIIATVNTETRQVLLVSTPRDYYVPLPISNGQPDKLTHAGIYGIDVSMGALEMLYETEIDYYFRVNFSGFEQIIDALGGIVVDSEVAFSSGGYEFTKGPNSLSGAEALAFARERKAFASGDRQRGKNQMAVIQGVIHKALSPALLKNFNSVLTGIAGSFEGSMPYEVLAGLVRDQLSQGGSWNVVSYSVDGTGASKKPYSLSTNAYVMIPDYDTVQTAMDLMDQVKNGEMLAQK